jgi:hypothetical protein
MVRGLPIVSNDAGSILPARVPCTVCGTRQVYRPSEVFIGSLPQIWKGEALR